MKVLKTLIFLLPLAFCAPLLAQTLEIVPLPQEQEFVSACSEKEHLKITLLKKELLQWHQRTIYVEKKIKDELWARAQLSRLFELELQHQNITQRLEELKHSSPCLTQMAHLNSLQESFIEKKQWLNDQRLAAKKSKNALSLCQIQLKNTSEIFEKAILSLEKKQKHKAYMDFGKTTFEADRVLHHQTDCRLSERKKLEQIRTHALHTLDQLQREI